MHSQTKSFESLQTLEFVASHRTCWRRKPNAKGLANAVAVPQSCCRQAGSIAIEVAVLTATGKSCRPTMHVNSISNSRRWSHAHQHRGCAKAAEKYPKELCRAICRGLMTQISQAKMQAKSLLRLSSTCRSWMVNNSIDVKMLARLEAPEKEDYMVG